MIQVAICDDQLDQRIKLSSLMQDYIDQKQLAAEVLAFSNPDQLLRMCEARRFHLYLLDVVMPLLNGIELGVEIRRLDRDAQLIYVTTAPEFALDSFASYPLGYLIKPLDQQKLFAMLDLAFARIGEMADTALQVRTPEGLRIIQLSSIAWCERVGKVVRYVLASGEQVHSVTIRQPFSEEIDAILKDRRFIQPHTSYAVNMSRVERLTDEGFILRGGAFVPVARKQLTAVRNAYLDFWFARGGQPR